QASIQVISESLQTTVNDIKMLRKYPSNSSSYVHPINMTTLPVTIMCITIEITACRRGKRVEDEKLPKKVRYEQKAEYL
ncbi:unnamed protein product, partial [Rotaria sordida]